jgi:transporter family protein
MALFLIVVALSLGKFSFLHTLDNKAIVFIILSGIAGALSWLFYFFAIKSGTVTGVVGIDRTSVLFAFILAWLFLGEHATWQKALGACLVAGGAILMAR